MLIGAVLVLLFLAGLGGWFYFAFYGSTYAALQRAEVFNFRRLQVARQPEAGTYRFFFATNRRAEPGETVPEARFGNQRDDRLTFGSFDTAIEPSLGLGMIIDRTKWFQNEVIQIRGLEELDPSGWVEGLRRQVRASPLGSLLVVVHGFREAFPSALRKTAFLSHILDIDTPVLLFDWPGDQGSSLSGYRRARQVAGESGAELARLLRLVIADVRPARLWLVANSMGGEVVADAFGSLYQDADLADEQTEIEDVVLTAPDVDRTEFDARFKSEIAALAGRLTVYVSSNDRALLLSRIVNRERRLGESTLSLDMLDEAVAVMDLVDPDSEAIALVDVTPVNRTRNFHNFSLETPEFFDDLYLRLTDPGVPQSRLLYRLRTADGAAYWVLTGGR